LPVACFKSLEFKMENVVIEYKLHLRQSCINYFLIRPLVLKLPDKFSFFDKILYYEETINILFLKLLYDETDAHHWLFTQWPSKSCQLEAIDKVATIRAFLGPNVPQ
jgi:hypothetical protein